MQSRRLRSDERAVSVVMGTVMLVGMVSIVMAVLAAGILGAGVFDQTPHAELICQEDDTGTVAIGFTDVRGLSAGNTEIRLQGEGSCGSWDGSGTLEKGDITIVDGGDCPDPLEPGDVLQVIGSDTLLDTYELRGVSTGFDQCESELEGGDLTVEDGEVIECDVVGDDGGRTDIDVEIEDGGTLIGEVKLNGNGGMTFKGGSITGDVVTEDVPTVDNGPEIDGDITVPSDGTGDTLDLKSGTEMDGAITAAEEDVAVGDGSVVNGPIETDGSVELEDGTVNGDIDAEGYTVVLKGDSLVDGDVTADTIDCKDDSEITGDGSSEC